MNMKRVGYGMILMLCSLLLVSSSSAADLVKLKGSGASFPAPFYLQWFKTYGNKE